jgi:hypothetical protein
MPNRKCRFKVEDIVPPRNVKGKSMWNNDTEVPRIIELRRQAYEALGGSLPLSKEIKLDITIHLPRNYNTPGDLDNFIKGICDGLMKCLHHPQLKLHEDFEKDENAKISPRSFAMIDDGKKKFSK